MLNQAEQYLSGSRKHYQIRKKLNKHANNREDLVNDDCKLDTENYDDTNISTFELTGNRITATNPNQEFYFDQYYYSY